MTAEHLALLNASIDQIVELETLDGTRFLATPLFVYEGEDNPDVFFLPVERGASGNLKTAETGQSILLEDILAVRTPTQVLA
ncbi:hypothetical protein [Granulicella sibirica]|uniref:Uncharacterized protein n=1 Tax=Granulicella sibirica TaxID=2479048 RepID=A0A4Q0T2V3_9BACT|nr:hypothetical protein [Granulicella sibirica]RXH57557.1 hypothetical protein GRAN_0867 [Granulicella sibirica]